jgi:DNA (cytosine-5)-methyltransferase 1
VIDLNTAELEDVFGAARELEVVTAAGSIVITPSKTERHKARRRRNGLEGSVFAGGGLLTEAGRRAGFECAWAVEVEDRYAELFETNHPSAVCYNMSVHEVDGERLPPVELMTIGLPCEPYSKKRNGNRGAVPEDHRNGDLVYWALRLVEDVAPWTVVVEEVEGFLNSGAFFILRGALERMGYTVDAKVLDSADFGELAGRRRAVVVATSDEAVEWPEAPAETPERNLGEVLVPAEELPESAWFDRSSKTWLFDHWDRQAAKGNKFRGKVLTPETTRLPCVSKGYWKQQGDGAVVAHPTRPETYRWLTVDEVAQVHGLPSGYLGSLPKTTAGEVLGQGVIVGLFEKVISAAAAR